MRGKSPGVLKNEKLISLGKRRNGERKRSDKENVKEKVVLKIDNRQLFANQTFLHSYARILRLLGTTLNHYENCHVEMQLPTNSTVADTRTWTPNFLKRLAYQFRQTKIGLQTFYRIPPIQLKNGRGIINFKVVKSRQYIINEAENIL